MNSREKLENLKLMLQLLIDTCESELSINQQLLSSCKNNTTKGQLLREQEFWKGKLEVAKYAKMFAE